MENLALTLALYFLGILLGWMLHRVYQAHKYQGLLKALGELEAAFNATIKEYRSTKEARNSKKQSTTPGKSPKTQTSSTSSKRKTAKSQ